MATKHLEYAVKLVGKAVAGFKRSDSKFERGPTGGEMLSDGIACYRESRHERRSQGCGFKKWPQPTSLQHPPC